MKRRIILGAVALTCLWLAMAAAAMPYAPALQVLMGLNFAPASQPTPPATMYDSLRDAATARGVTSYTIAAPSLTYNTIGTSRFAATIDSADGSYRVVLLNRRGSPVWTVDTFEEESCAAPSR